MVIFTYIKRLLGWFGFLWCQHCGRRLALVDVRGWEQKEIWECPHCDNLERFDMGEFERWVARLPIAPNSKKLVYMVDKEDIEELSKQFKKESVNETKRRL